MRAHPFHTPYYVHNVPKHRYIIWFLLQFSAHYFFAASFPNVILIPRALFADVLNKNPIDMCVAMFAPRPEKHCCISQQAHVFVELSVSGQRVWLQFVKNVPSGRTVHSFRIPGNFNSKRFYERSDFTVVSFLSKPDFLQLSYFPCSLWMGSG